MGSPTAPNDAQYAQLLQAGGLAEMGEPQTVSVVEGKASLKFHLPRQGVSLLALKW